jgi:hypothetical protein
MKTIVVTDQAAGTAGVKLVEPPEPQAAISGVVVQIHASGFTGDELSWPSTWTAWLDGHCWRYGERHRTWVGGRGRAVSA